MWARQPRRACGHDNAIQIVLGDILLDLLLADVGAGELQIAGYGHIGKLFCIASQILHVQDSGDVQAAVTDVHSNGHGTSQGI